MKNSVQPLLDLIAKQNPADAWIFEEMKKKDSEVNQLLEQLAFNMALKKLNDKKYQQFINLLENQDNPGQVWLFVKKNIPDFEKELASQFKDQLNQCKKGC